MDFEKLYQKYKDGTATEEEKKLVEEEIRKAKEINNILEEKPEDTPNEEKSAILKQIDTERIKDALSYFNFKQFIRTIIIVVSVIIVLTIVGVGSIFGIAYYNANQSDNVTKEQAVDLAKDYVAEYIGTTPDKIIVGEVDKELDIQLHLTKSKYIYEIELSHTSGEYTVVVNTESGYAHITDLDGKSRFDRDFDD